MAATISNADGATATVGAATFDSSGGFAANVDDWLGILLSVSNDGTNGASCFTSFQIIVEGDATITVRANILYDPGAAGAGANLVLATGAVTTGFSAGKVRANFSPNFSQAAMRVLKIVPGASEAISFVEADATGLTGNTTTYSAATVSVTNLDMIFAAAAIETDDSITGDSDTTNGSWSTVDTVLADGGADASCMCLTYQYKTVTGTGNQDWACTSATARDSARSYMVLRSASTDTIFAQSVM